MKVTKLSYLSQILRSKLGRCNGQWVTITASVPVSLNRYPTDGSARIRLDDDFCPRRNYIVKINWAEDYSLRMSKLLGCDYKASDANRIHIVKNVLMMYIKTRNVCLIYIPKEQTDLGITIDGRTPTAEEVAKIARYTSKAGANNKPIVEYRTVGIRNVTRIAIDNDVYDIDIKDYNLDEALPYTLTEYEAYAPDYAHSEKFATLEDAQERMKEMYHYVAIDGNPDAVRKATLDAQSASVSLTDGNCISWDISAE